MKEIAKEDGVPILHAEKKVPDELGQYSNSWVIISLPLYQYVLCSCSSDALFLYLALTLPLPRNTRNLNDLNDTFHHPSYVIASLSHQVRDSEGIWVGV